MGFLMSTLGFLRTGVGKAVAGVAIVAVILFSVFKAGEKSNKLEEEIKRKEEYIETRKEIDDAIEDAPSDFDSAAEFLRNRNNQQ